MDKSVIPKGDYCYVWREVPSKENGWVGKVNHCPYFSSKTIGGVEFPWCNFIDAGGWDNKGYTKEEEAAVLAHFGGDEKKMDEALCASLLFDSVKECGINVGDEDYV